MRIAMLSWETLHSIAVGGGAAHVSELAGALVRKGHEVHVFTRMAAGQADYQAVEGVHYYRCAYRGHGDFVDDVNSMCRAFVDRVFGVEDSTGKSFDVIHAHDWLTVNAMIWIKQGRGRRGVFTIHSTEYARCGNVFHNGRSHRIRAQERAGTYWADRVIAVSNATREEVAWMYEVPLEKVAVVHNGVRRARFEGHVDPGGVKRRYGLGPVDPTVLFCGRLDYQKGPDILVEAIPDVLRMHPQARFVFAGDGGMRGGLEHRVKQMGVSHAVRFLGYRSGQELVDLFKMAEMVCVPSRNEPFGIVVLEAWAAGKAVVVTQNGGPGEYVDHEVNGLKIYDHPNSVVWGLDRLLSDFDLAAALGRRGRQAVEEAFSWEKVADETLGVYRAPVAEAGEVEAAVEADVEAVAIEAAGEAVVAAAPSQNGDAQAEVNGRARLDEFKLTSRLRRRELALLDGLLAQTRCTRKAVSGSILVRGPVDELFGVLSSLHERLSHHRPQPPRLHVRFDGGAGSQGSGRSGNGQVNGQHRDSALRAPAVASEAG